MNKLQQEIVMFLCGEEQRTGNIYMDKTLSDGCLFYYNQNNSNEIIELWKAEYYSEDNDVWFSVRESKYEEWCGKIWIHQKIIDRYWETLILNIYEVWLTLDFKILWHYGITALERYIRSKWTYLECKIEYDYRTYLLHWNEPFLIPNKEPHLYSEEENKDLLKLLKELWNN